MKRVFLALGALALGGIVAAGILIASEPAAPRDVPAGAAEGPVPPGVVGQALDDCTAGATDAGIASMDSVVARLPDASDALVARGLCHWTRWSETDDPADAERAHRDLSAAINAVEAGRDRAQATPLDRMYAHRAFVANAVDNAWTRTLTDLDRAVALAPRDPTHVLDRAVVRSTVGDTAAAVADLRRFLAVADSADTERRSVVEEMLADLGAGDV